MLFYRVKEEYDNKPIYRKTKNHMVRCGTYIGKELYTATEAKNMYNFAYEFCEKIDIPLNKTFYSFGARFSIVS